MAAYARISGEKLNAGRVLVAKLNTDESSKAPNRFGIRGIPTLIAFKNGRETFRQVGAVSEQMLDGLLPS